MAIFHSAIFDSMRNKLANTVLYKKGPDGIIRTLPDKVKNPRTADQQTQRARMACVIDLSRRFAPIIATGFCNRPIRLTAYNMFTKLNVANVDVDDRFQPTPKLDKLVVSDGILMAPNVDVENNGSNITFKRKEQAADGLSAADDVIYAGIYEEELRASRLHKVGTRSETGQSEFPMPDGWSAEKVHVYLFAVSKSKKRTSPTVHVK